MCGRMDKPLVLNKHSVDAEVAGVQQGHREFPFWKRKIPPAKEKFPENSRSVKCSILHALTQ